MAYGGYLIRVNNSYTIPMDMIVASSYKVTYSVLDEDAYRDGNGVLHRNAIRKVPTVEFKIATPKDNVIESVFASIASNYINAMEKKVNLSIYIPEVNDYYSGSFYLPDTPFTISKIDNGHVYYEDVAIKFIGY